MWMFLCRDHSSGWVWLRTWLLWLLQSTISRLYRHVHMHTCTGIIVRCIHTENVCELTRDRHSLLVLSPARLFPLKAYLHWQGFKGHHLHVRAWGVKLYIYMYHSVRSSVVLWLTFQCPESIFLHCSATFLSCWVKLIAVLAGQDHSNLTSFGDLCNLLDRFVELVIADGSRKQQHPVATLSRMWVPLAQHFNSLVKKVSGAIEHGVDPF